MSECCETKDIPRSDEELKDLKVRLNRIIGQLNGVSKMLDENRYCKDILVQISAIESAIKQVGYIVLETHLKTCVKDKIKNNDEEVIDETIDIIKKLK